ncbi:hypothetical protein B0T22DRAFT_387952 [Podospora appendiculata]|uniref:Signal transduction histidine-protein kinase n=1 Tax=Podospora appendiculata TaxID=314037 RepID=A0AAE0WZ05_9PEZI|nr:hypothetical protein B0T22DRAFT_387952 [Podospora appendiculata]
MLRTLLAACLSLSSTTLAAPTAAICDRDFLKAQAAAYVAAQAAGKVDTLKASSSVSYTQNFKTATLATGILSTPLKIDSNRSTYDTTQCATYTELISLQSGANHVIGTQMRFSDGELSKMEIIVTSTGDWLFNPTNTLKYASQESWTEIPEAKRDTRAVIQAAGDAYLDLFNDKKVKVPWGNPCARLEGGSYIQPSCNVGVPSGVKNINRRYVVDEVFGTVDVFFSFGGNDPDSHEFRVESGKLRYVHTMTVMKSRHHIAVASDTANRCRPFSIPRLNGLWFSNPIRARDHHPRPYHAHHEASLIEVVEVAVKDAIFRSHIGHQSEPWLNNCSIFAKASLPTSPTDSDPIRLPSPSVSVSPARSQPAFGVAGTANLTDIFYYSPLALLELSPSCCITRASARFLSDWRLSADQCIGHQLHLFLEKQIHPSTSISQVHAIIGTVDDAISARAERTSKPINTIHEAACRARVLPVFNDHQLLAITLEWHERPTALIESELVKPGLSTDEAFRILVQALKDYAIFLLDTTGHIATWNMGAELLKGYTRDEIIGKHFSVFYGKDDLEAGKPDMELAICLREGRVEDEGWRYKKDGTRFWANVIITAVYKDGLHVGFGKVTRDLTERKASESRLITAYEESEKLKSDFLANMSHEIRTPMHGMLSACSLLLDTDLTVRQRDIANIMDESGKVLLQVINDILDYSKLASGSFSVTSDIVGVASIIASVVRGVQTTLHPAVHFELFLAPNLPKSVQGDPLRFRQIVNNLVGNAAKFTEKGSIRVKASLQAEDVDSYTVLTEVTDTGIGIPENSTAHLFMPFTQFDVTTTKRYKGTGLGLSISKSLAELMGGRIGYRPNVERHGSVFWFTARFKKIKSLGQIQDWKNQLAKDGSLLPVPATETVDLQAELAKIASARTLLLVEDNVINQKVMLGILRSLGFKNVQLASNGAEAVTMVRAKPVGFDLVLMDINMPILDGHQASSRIRESGIKIPIVAMTAYALKGDRERCLEYGMNDYIPKPVDKKYLIRILAKWLMSKADGRRSMGPDQLPSPELGLALLDMNRALLDKNLNKVQDPSSVVEVASEEQKKQPGADSVSG